MIDNVILVDEHDNEIGTMQKLEAHLLGKLHRAFSIFIFNSKGELLLQQRAAGKYHSGGKWTNTCCSHPRLGEDTHEAANRRLMEEMGMQCNLQFGFSFTYEAVVNETLSENEYDHVFFGISDEEPVLNPEEAAGYKYIALGDLKKDIRLSPGSYTEWLKICFDKVVKYYDHHLS